MALPRRHPADGGVVWGFTEGESTHEPKRGWPSGPPAPPARRRRQPGRAARAIGGPGKTGGGMTRTIATLGEVGLIDRLRRRIPVVPSVLVGIGDDTAVLRATRTKSLLFASDMLIEGVHFTRGHLAPHWIGWKALACNISDIAAMGGVPKYAVVSLGLPRQVAVSFVDRLYHGLVRCARRFGVAIVGGDTVRAPCVVIDVAILGTVRPKHLVLRSGAKLGERVFVTGRLGGALAHHRHATFTPRLREAQWLVAHLPVHAMIDLSDGLASDLWQLARASRVTFQIHEDAIPVAQAAETAWHALMDGEDFELLFTVPQRIAPRVPAAIGRLPLTEIGVVTAHGAGVELVRTDGRITSLIPKGFKHF